ncbi:MAG: VIT1/CCC1 transporter family protein [Mailhella sp.]|nr:VIT1/CCC1 transporter family protein [Mailhella sp.]
MRESTLRLLETMQVNEKTDSEIYRILSSRIKGENGEVLRRMAEDEAAHCAVWGRYTGKACRPNRLKVYLYVIMGWIFGLTFVINLLEFGEEKAGQRYTDLIEDVPEARYIMEEEKKHEEKLASMVDEERLKYIGSMVLGLNDALVELTGALAGFTLALGSNATVGLAGFITGVSATLSMAASEYLSKKSDPSEKHPFKAAVYTGIAYLITVACLLLPYVLFSSPYAALGFCLFNAACIIAAFTFFVSVVRRETFRPQFMEMITISFGVAAVSFLIGWAAKTWMGIEM